MNKEEIQERLDQIAEKYDADIDDVSEKFSEAVSEVKEYYTIPASDEEILSSALSIVSSVFLTQNRAPVGSKHINGITIGPNRIWEWNRYEDGVRTDHVRDVLVAHALVQPEDDPMGLATIYFDADDGVDVADIKRFFTEPLQTFSGAFGVSESDFVNGYKLYTNENTNFEEEGDMDWGDTASRVTLLRQSVPKAELSNITAHLSSMKVLDNGDKRAGDHGIDLKRVKGTIQDRFVAEDKSYANFSVHDDTIFDESDLEGTPVGSDKQRTRGLTCWVDPTQAEYGINSLCDFYGTITMDDEGKVQMNVRGIVPLMPRPVDDGRGGTSSEV